jgi:transcription initiation factor IIF auxiliary subunit
MPMDIPPDFRVQMADYPFDPRSTSRLVESRNQNSRPLYHVYIRLEGPDVSLVREVLYKLHPSVNPPTMRMVRSETNPDFTMDLWLWGTFVVNASVTDIRERQFDLPQHLLTFDSYFDKALSAKLNLKFHNTG